ncbi:MAG TPA: glycosyltransferase family 2 protein [Pseudobdellovibrionaceae bacterium]|nr:glycosyltransferase family 2 protein [Pseudobdellovibrionaceae bacterium]
MTESITTHKSTEKLPLSLVVITFNEEKNIERCLKSVPFASEWIVLDSFSTDRTKDLSLALGARFFQEPWKGYGAQKQSATLKASYDWVLSLDADEELSPELAQELLKNFDQLQADVGYRMPRRSFYLGRWIDHGGWFPDYQLRLFHRKHASWTLSSIHEQVKSHRTQKLVSPILHYVFRNLEHQVQTNNNYSSLQAQDLFTQRKNFSLFKLITKPGVKFLELYFFKSGFLDGLPGFIIAVGGAYSVFLKHAKLWEIENDKKNHTNIF